MANTDWLWESTIWVRKKSALASLIYFCLTTSCGAFACGSTKVQNYPPFVTGYNTMII